MRNIYLLPAVTIIGITVSHAMFSVMVYVSNIRLNEIVSLLSAAGYITVPNHLVAAGLKNWEPASAGALFFSLTIGAGLCIATFMLVLTWRTFFRSSSIALMVMLMLWAALLYRANADGVNIWATAACLIIPFVAARATLLLLSESSKPSPLAALAFPLAGFLIIIAFWAPRADGDAFLRIRDHLLLPNPVGEKITRFYYQYTLYPAEVFKSLDQKLLKTCTIHMDDPDMLKKIKDRLHAEDYLSVDGPVSVDLRITECDGQLVLHQNNREILELPATGFMTDPEGALQAFSKKTDTWRFFREITFLSLVIASPFLVYLLLQTAIFACLFLLPSVHMRMVLSTLICAGLGVGLSLPVGPTSGDALTPGEIENHLRSDKRYQRIEALKALSEMHVDMNSYPELVSNIDKRSVPERYWLAKALAYSRSPGADEMLQKFLKDPHPNVVCMALFSLGKRKQKQAPQEMIHILETHDHWYVQWYAYRSLRRLGWIQPASARSDSSSPPALSPR